MGVTSACVVAVLGHQERAFSSPIRASTTLGQNRKDATTAAHALHCEVRMRYTVRCVCLVRALLYNSSRVCVPPNSSCVCYNSAKLAMMLYYVITEAGPTDQICHCHCVCVCVAVVVAVRCSSEGRQTATSYITFLA